MDIINSLKKIGVFLFLLVAGTTGTAQDMKKGFELLEAGSYKQASIFFEDVINEYPNNKTARICYARSIGLDGQADKALQIFQKMNKEYPQDMEVLLNEAEAWLWKKEGSKAIPLYTNVLAIDSLNFTAHLGMANAYANGLDYDQAQVYIQKALVIDPGNPGAMISNKFIRLGKSSSFIQKQDFQSAEKILSALEVEYPNDRDVVMAMLQLNINDGSKAKAKSNYEKYDTLFNSEIAYLLDGSLIYHLNKKGDTSVMLAEKALDLTKSNDDPTLKARALERYGQSLVWNKETQKYQDFIDNNQEYSDSIWYNSLQAMYYDYNANPKSSSGFYRSILHIDSTSYAGLLGAANAEIALDHPDNASTFINQAYAKYGSRKEIVSTINKFSYPNTPSIHLDYSILEDNGENLARIQSAGIILPVSYKLQFTADYNGRTTEQTNLNTDASVQSIGVGVRYKWLPHLYTSAQVIPTRLKAVNDESNKLLTEFKLEYKPRLLDQLEIKYFTDVLDYNTDLISNEITERSIALSYNFFTLKNIGWFNQFQFSNFSDENNRTILYSSLYYQWRLAPIVKTGVSFQWLNFSENRPEIYFSPSTFTSQEVFLEIFQPEDVTIKNQFLYRILIAGGLQSTDDNKNQGTFRSYASMGYKAHYGTSVNVYGQWSNVSSAVASGFSFYQIGIKLSHRFSKGLFKILEEGKE